MILSGELQVGQQLPPERQLAQSMGVSRAVVNSGIAGWAPPAGEFARAWGRS